MEVTTSATATCGISRLGNGGNSGSKNSSPVQLTELVEHGDARGRELGYPTANVPVQDGEIRDGVWVGTVCVDPLGLGQSFAASRMVVGGVPFTWTDVFNGGVRLAAVALSSVVRRTAR